MNVLIVSANRVRQPVPVFPFGACMVAQAAERAGHQVSFLDLMFQKDPAVALTARLAKFRPDVVGLSMRNIDTNDVANPTDLADETAALVAAIRRTSRAPVVLGGAAFGVMPRQLLRRIGGDWAIPIEGDAVFPRLLDAIASGGDPAAVRGVMAPDGRLSPFARNGDSLRDSTVSDLRRWVDVSAYLAAMATVPIQTKRGCPFECIYCTYKMVEGPEYHLHPPQRVVEAIARLARQGIRDIEFVDNVFNSPYEHALAICQGLAAARLPVRLQSVELNPRFFDQGLCSAMEAAGFTAIGITVESAADAVLAALGKGYGSADVHRAAEVVRRSRLPCLWVFMMGGPGETPETVEETLRFARERIRPTDSAFFQLGVRIYPGTELERRARAEGLLTAAADDMLTPVFYVSPHTPLGWLKGRMAAAVREHLNFIPHDTVTLPLLQTVLRVCYRLGVRPPLWRFTRTVRRVLRLLRLHA